MIAHCRPRAIFIKSFSRCTYILKVRRFHINIPIKSIVIMGWQCCFFICRLSPGGRVTHQKLYFWYEDSGRRRSEKEHFTGFIDLVLIYFWFCFGGYMFLGIPDNFGHFAGIGEKDRERLVQCTISWLCMTWGYRVPEPWRLYQNILFLVFGCWRAGEDDRGGCL